MTRGSNVIWDRLQLLMIDEVHLLREERGAVLEVIMARARRSAPSARLVAVSASVGLAWLC